MAEVYQDRLFEVERPCTKCGETKPLEAFHRKASGKNGLNAQCKACVLPALAQYRQDNPEKFKASYEDWHRRHPESKRKTAEKQRRNNPEWDREKKRRYANSDKGKNKQAEWRAANPGKFAEYCHKHYEQNKAHYAEYSRRYWQANPDKVAANNHRRRARKLAVGGEVTAADWRLILEGAGGCCYWCKAGCESLQMDHYLPLALGGSHSPENIVAACQTCNFRKGAKHPDVWREQLEREKRSSQ